MVTAYSISARVLLCSSRVQVPALVETARSCVGAKEGDVEGIVLSIRLIPAESLIAVTAMTGVILQPLGGVQNDTTEPVDIAHETSGARVTIDIAVTDIMTEAVRNTTKRRPRKLWYDR